MPSDELDLDMKSFRMPTVADVASEAGLTERELRSTYSRGEWGKGKERPTNEFLSFVRELVADVGPASCRTMLKTPASLPRSVRRWATLRELRREESPLVTRKALADTLGAAARALPRLRTVIVAGAVPDRPATVRQFVWDCVGSAFPGVQGDDAPPWPTPNPSLDSARLRLAQFNETMVEMLLQSLPDPLSLFPRLESALVACFDPDALRFALQLEEAAYSPWLPDHTLEPSEEVGTPDGLRGGLSLARHVWCEARTWRYATIAEVLDEDPEIVSYGKAMLSSSRRRMEGALDRFVSCAPRWRIVGRQFDRTVLAQLRPRTFGAAWKRVQRHVKSASHRMSKGAAPLAGTRSVRTWGALRFDVETMERIRVFHGTRELGELTPANSGIPMQRHGKRIPRWRTFLEFLGRTAHKRRPARRKDDYSQDERRRAAEKGDGGAQDKRLSRVVESLKALFPRATAEHPVKAVSGSGRVFLFAVTDEGRLLEGYRDSIG